MKLAEWRGRAPGLGVCVLLALVAYGLGTLLPLVGGAVFAITLGVVIATWRAPSPALKVGIGYAGKKVLQASIVVLGGSLSLAQIWQTGQDSLAVMLITLGTALALAYFLGKALKVESNLASLVGVGTAICGGFGHRRHRPPSSRPKIPRSPFPSPPFSFSTWSRWSRFRPSGIFWGLVRRASGFGPEPPSTTPPRSSPRPTPIARWPVITPPSPSWRGRR